MGSELVTPGDLSRRAVIYIRQSTPNQVLTNQESLRLQYALRQRARELGWHEADVEVIDRDLGESGATAANRTGFKDLVARVSLGEVGIVLSYEVTRLTRNCSDWYPLLDLCSYRRCLIGDRDGVYDPATQNGRLLLGLKGTISEMELHTLRGRLTAGLLAKAGRGELALPLPVGLERDAAGAVVVTPDREVEARLRLVFDTFLARRTVSQVLRAFLAAGPALPRGEAPGGGLRWRAPTKHALTAILKNPAYAGAFVYGRTETVRPPARRRPAPGPQTPARRVAGRRPRPLPRLHPLGHARGDRGHPARQPRPLRPQRHPRRPARRRRAAARPGPLRDLRAQDDGAVPRPAGLRLPQPGERPRPAALPGRARRAGRRGRRRGLPGRRRAGRARGLGAGRGRAAGGRGGPVRGGGAAGRAAALPRSAGRAAVRQGRPRQPPRRGRARAALGGGAARAARRRGGARRAAARRAAARRADGGRGPGSGR